MIEKIQSNGFDDQRYKQPYSIPAGSSVSSVFNVYLTLILFKQTQDEMK